MAEFERVPLRPRPDRDWLPTASVVVAACLVLVIWKPWDSGRPGAAGGPSPMPTFYVGPTERVGPRPYDPILFGLREPDPAWELWPAGYVVQFGLAGPVTVRRDPVATPAESPAASDPPGSSAAPSAGPATEPPSAEGFVDLGPADHLVALGINFPLEARVETIRLARLEDDAITPVPIVRLPTLWTSSHFVVIAPEAPGATGEAGIWKPGLYRLELISASDEVRVIDLRVRPPGPGSSPAQTPSDWRPPYR